LVHLYPFTFFTSQELLWHTDSVLSFF
jgi:hypothetical protein